MKTFDFMWPENLECSKFPEDGTDDSLCISNNASSKSEKNSFSTPVSVIHKNDRKNNGMADYKNNVTGFSHRSIGFICPVQLKAPQVMGYELNVAGKVTKDCGAPCKSLFFDETERTILRYWISSWAALSVASCLFIVRFLLGFKDIYLYINLLNRSSPSPSTPLGSGTQNVQSSSSRSVTCLSAAPMWVAWERGTLSLAASLFNLTQDWVACKWSQPLLKWVELLKQRRNNLKIFQRFIGSPTVQLMHNSIHDALLLLDGCFCLVDMFGFSLAAGVWIQMGPWSYRSGRHRKIVLNRSWKISKP